MMFVPDVMFRNVPCWQSKFIDHMMPIIGHAAWQGYQQQGRGMVVCQIPEILNSTIDWATTWVPFEHTFLPHAQIPANWHLLGLIVAAIPPVLQAISSYDPTQAIVLMLQCDGEIQVHLLHTLAISPTQAYQQVQQRHSEFHLCTTV